MNIRNLVRKTTEDTGELKRRKEYYNDFMKYDINIYQLEVSENYFTLCNNTGKELVTFGTKDVIKIMKEKKII